MVKKKKKYTPVAEVTKYVFIPLIISGNVRKQVIPRVETTLREELENNAQFYVLLEDSATFHTSGDDIEAQIKKKDSITNYRLRVMYTILKQPVLYRLLQNDLSGKGAKNFIKKLVTKAYRKYSKAFGKESKVVSVLWSDSNAIVLLDKLDLEKAGVAKLTAAIAKKLQRVYNWPTICVYDDFDRDLTFFVKKFKSIKKVRI